jgi:hypothetical protein
MLRFILKRKVKCSSGGGYESLYTLDFENTELEDRLTGGGMSEDSFDITELVGVEILESKKD